MNKIQIKCHNSWHCCEVIQEINQIAYMNNFDYTLSKQGKYVVVETQHIDFDHMIMDQFRTAIC